VAAAEDGASNAGSRSHSAGCSSSRSGTPPRRVPVLRK
jgi:hypothetical protein